MFVEPVHNAHTNKKKCIVIFVGENSENMSQPVDHVSPQILWDLSVLAENTIQHRGILLLP